MTILVGQNELHLQLRCDQGTSERLRRYSTNYGQMGEMNSVVQKNELRNHDSRKFLSWRRMEQPSNATHCFCENAVPNDNVEVAKELT